MSKEFAQLSRKGTKELKRIWRIRRPVEVDEQDTKRLDWLAQTPDNMKLALKHWTKIGRPKLLRVAIDAAMKITPPK